MTRLSLPSFAKPARVLALGALAGALQANACRDRFATGSRPREVAALLSDQTRADVAARRCLTDSVGAIVGTRSTEAFAAINPADPQHLIAVWQTGNGRGSVIQSAASFDGGGQWGSPQTVPTNQCAGGVADAQNTSDPWVAIGTDGRAYASAIAWTPKETEGPDSVSALVVVASADGGRSWGPPQVAARAPAFVAFDNLSIAVDPTRHETVYAATTYGESPARGGYSGRLGFTRSDDGGRSWIPVRTVTPAVSGERIGAPQLLVDLRSGRLYAVYSRIRRDERVIGVITSTDRGDSWTAEVVATVLVRGPSSAKHPANGRDLVLAPDIVQAAISPNSGLIAIAFADGRRDSLRLAVSVVSSVDGRRWTSPLTISDSSSETAWLPAIAISASDVIGVSYLSATLGDSTGRAALRRVMLQRLRVARDALLPTQLVELDRSALRWPGDYHALVAQRDGFRVFVASADTQLNHTNIVTVAHRSRRP